MRNDFLYCNKLTKVKKIKCFGVCDLNDTLYLSPPWLDLSPSHSSVALQRFTQWKEGRRKAARGREIKTCNRFYLYK